MNDDASTFDLPDYVHSRLMPIIVIDFPEADDDHSDTEGGKLGG